MLFLLFPQTLTQGVIHNMNDSIYITRISEENLLKKSLLLRGTIIPSK